MVAQILITLLFYIVLMYVSINLLGLFVRGLFPQHELSRMKKEAPGVVNAAGGAEEYIKQQKRTTVITLILNIIFFYSLYFFWNIWVSISAAVIMIGRLPDLLWDIKHGKKTDPKQMSKNAIYYLSAILPWLALPILYFSLY